MRAFKLIITVTFVLLLFLPMASAAVMGINTNELPKYTDYISSDMLFNNKENSSGFFEDTEHYASEKLPIRNDIICADSFIESTLLKSETSNVVVGKNGYLFSSEELDDCRRSNTMSQIQINNTVQTLDLIDEYCRNNGVEFKLVIVPDKGTALNEKLPYYIKKSNSKSNLELISKQIKNRSYFIDLSDVLNNQDELYHKTDTHWNYLGAQKAYFKIMSELGKDSKKYEDLKMEKKRIWRGDLTDLLYPEKERISDYQYVSDLFSRVSSNYEIGISRERKKYSTQEYINYITEDRDNKVRDIKTKNRHENGSVIMLRDSFARALMPYFIDNFRSCEFIISNAKLNSYTHSIQNADYLILEIAERNLVSITSGAQLFEAVRTQAPRVEKTVKSKNNTAQAVHDYSYYEIRGRLDEKMLEKSSDITVRLSNETGDYFYKAVPVYSDSEVTEEGGCSNYLLTSRFDDVPKGNYSVEVTANGISTGEITNISIE